MIHIKNKNIENIINTYKIALYIIIISQIIFSIVFFCIVGNFVNSENLINGSNIQILVVISLIVICLIIDIIFYKVKISRARYFLYIKPIEGIIEDLILVSYGYTETSGISRKEYRLYPVIKVEDKLYFTYGNYSISKYNQKYVRINNKYTYLEIFRKDNSKVQIGDKAYLYIKKELDIKVIIDANDNYRLNRQKEHFENRNSKYDINILNRLNFFEGIIDIEPLSFK